MPPVFRLAQTYSNGYKVGIRRCPSAKATSSELNTLQPGAMLTGGDSPPEVLSSDTVRKCYMCNILHFLHFLHQHGVWLRFYYIQP